MATYTYTTPKINFAVNDVGRAAHLNAISHNTGAGRELLVDFPMARASGSLALTTIYQDVPGATITLGRAGSWRVEGIFYFYEGNEASITLHGELYAGGLSGTPVYIETRGSGGTATHCAYMIWALTGKNSGDIVKLQGKKSGGAGSSLIQAYSLIAARWIGP